ncbi:MAG: o-succinylbenzoate synthase [Acidimicrobiaceae bacterium]|nr:o-succinylbenzoate synthase [Acidimicrobiaceae bacterium]
MQVTLREFELALARPLRTAHGSITVRRGIEVRVGGDACVGVGEAAPLPGFGVETYDESLVALGRWAEDPEGEPPSEPCAAAAVESALTQLDAEIEGVTLSALLAEAAPKQRRIATHALVSDLDPEAAARHAAHAAAAGHLAVKLKVAAHHHDDSGGDGSATMSLTDQSVRIAHVRRALPAGVALRLDANGGWDRSTAVKVLRPVGHLDIEFIEEPTPQPADWAQISRTVGIGVAADEHLRDVAALDRLIEVGAIEVAVLKPAVLGGPHAVYDLARRAAMRGVRSVVSSFICGPAGLRIARDTAVAVDPRGVHGIGTATLFADPMPEDVTPSDGYLPVPTEASTSAT